MIHNSVKKKKDKVIRVGDTVRIVNPKFFVRCGYPISEEIAIAKFKAEFEVPLTKFFYENCKGLLDYVNDTGIEESVIKAMARAYNKNIWLYGGKERQIYTEERPEAKNLLGTVQLIKYCKTGIYNHGYTCEEDHMPPYLSDEKVHKILTISISSNDPLYFASIFNRIEAANVEKLYD